MAELLLSMIQPSSARNAAPLGGAIAANFGANVETYTCTFESNIATMDEEGLGRGATSVRG
jgi:hypothetical protein